MVTVTALALTQWSRLPTFFVTLMLVVTTGAVVHSATGISPRRISIPGVWFLTYVGLIILPAHWVASDHDYGATTDRFMLGARLGLIATAAGIWIGTRALGTGRATWASQLTRPVRALGNDALFGLAFAFATMVALMLTLQYLRDVPTIPLFYMIQHPGEYFTLALLREESLKLLDSPFRYFYSLLQTLGFPLLTMIAWGTYRATGHRGWLWATMVVGGTAFFYASLTIAKGPVAFIVLALMLYHYLEVGGRLRAGIVAAGTILFFVFPIVVILLISEDLRVSFGTAVISMMRRVFYDPAWTLYDYFEVVPRFVDFQGGRTVGLLSRMVGGESFNIENAVALISGETTQATSTANATFVGNLYVDWGYTGVLLGGLLAGGLLALAHAFACRIRRTPVALAVTAHLMFTAILLSITSLPVVLMTNGALLAPIVGYTLLASARALRPATGLLEKRPRGPSATYPAGELPEV